ncbi:MAG: YceI family protein [Candidatus Kapaibacteriota bacterium]
MLNVLLVALIAATAAFAGTGFSSVKGKSETYSLNNAVGKNGITFHSVMPVEEIHGTADEVTGRFQLDPTNLEMTKGEFTVQVTSMKTAIAKRDEHMYSSTWLDAEKYPTISAIFKSLTNVKATMQDGRYVATAKAVGTFTMHGVTKPLTADVVITWVPASAESAKRAPGNLALITANFTVALADFGVQGKGDVIGTKVGKTIDVKTNFFANVQ